MPPYFKDPSETLTKILLLLRGVNSILAVSTKSPLAGVLGALISSKSASV